MADLGNSVDLALVASSGVKIGIDPLGGAAVHFWQPIIERYRLNAAIVNDAVDPTFRFMTADWDGKIRMDCSSPYAMASLIQMRDKFDVAFANDTDADRHGIVTRSGGLMNPNHFLAAAIAYLFAHRPEWGEGCGDRQDHRLQLDHRPCREEAEPQAGRDAGRDSNGLSRGSAAARSALPARRARAPPSSSGTERCGPPTRTAS